MAKARFNIFGRKRIDIRVTEKQWKAFIKVLNRPAQIKPALARLFSETNAFDRKT